MVLLNLQVLICLVQIRGVAMLSTSPPPSHTFPFLISEYLQLNQYQYFYLFFILQLINLI